MMAPKAMQCRCCGDIMMMERSKNARKFLSFFFVYAVICIINLNTEKKKKRGKPVLPFLKI